MKNFQSRLMFSLLAILSLTIVLITSQSVASQINTSDANCQEKDNTLESCSQNMLGLDNVSYQDISSSGPLTHIFVGAETSVQVAHALDGSTYEFYPPSTAPGDAGTFVVVDGILYAPNFSAHNGSATGSLGSYTPFTEVSQSQVSGSGTIADPYRVVTIVDVGSTGLRILQTDTYVIGEEAYQTNLQISNTGSSSKSLVLYRAADCYLGTSDYGYGLVNATNGSVACTKNPNNDPPGRILQFLPLSAGNNYYQASYSQIWSWIGSHQPFPDTCRCNEYIDNGMGISWNITIPSGGQVQKSHLTTFSPLGSLPLTLEKTADNPSSNPGATNGYTISINNPNPTSVTVTSVEDNLPNGFSYINGSTTGFINANPTINGQTLTWNGSFAVPASGSISMHFAVTVSNVPDQYTNNVHATASGYSVSSAQDTAPITVEVTVSSIDMGFRPNPNGYSFNNYGGYYPLPPELFDFTNSDTVVMFGEEQTCAYTIGNICILKLSAGLWNEAINFTMNGGHCDGMTTTSLRFFKSLNSPGEFQEGANTTYDLQKSNIRRYIAYSFALQDANPVAAARNEGLQKTPNQVLQQIYLSMLNGAPDPVDLVIYNSTRTSGHSILPYAIEDKGNDTYWVKVYDNNHHNDNNRYVVFNTQANTWSYNLGGSLGTWSGDQNSQSIGVIPLSIYIQQPQCPWCGASTNLNSVSSIQENILSQAWLNGQGQLLITDSLGRRIGFVGQQFVNEIPNAFENIPLGGLGLRAEPIYFLPSSDAYSIQLSGVLPTLSDDVSFAYFGQEFAIAVSNLSLDLNSTDQLTITSSGSEIMYSASNSQEADLTMTAEGSISQQFTAKGVDIGNNESVTMRRNLVSNQLLVSYEQANNGVYTIELKKIDGIGLSFFLHNDLSIGAGNTHVFDLNTWNGSSTITVCTDIGSDGTIDDCVEIENQGPTIYLPIVNKP